MKKLIFIPILLLASCQYLPELAKTVDDIATDGVIQLQIDKEAFNKETDISVSIEIKNKDPQK